MVAGCTVGTPHPLLQTASSTRTQRNMEVEPIVLECPRHSSIALFMKIPPIFLAGAFIAAIPFRV